MVAQSNDVIARVKRLSTDYLRGGYTDTEFVDLILQTLVNNNASEENVAQTSIHIPNSALAALENRMHEMVEMGFYLPNTYIGDNRSQEEIQREAYARQSVVKRIHHAFIRAVLVRRYRLTHGW